MRIDIRPVLSSLLRNRTGALLVAAQIAIALAVLVNAVYIVKQRVQLIGRPSGMDVANMFVVLSKGFSQHFDYDSALKADAAYLNALPDVIASTPLNHLPLSGGGSSREIFEKPVGKGRKTSINYFEADEHAVAALGVKLASGRGFNATEILPPQTGSAFVAQIILSAAAAREIFPDDNALGKTIYDNLGSPATIVGVIEHMQGSWVSWDKVDHVALVPRLPSGPSVVYLVRAKPGRRDALMADVEVHLVASNPNRVIPWVRTMDYIKAGSYQQDRNMAIFLVFVSSLLLAITALGIFGLATFNVSTRTRQIGTRRAIGARRSDIIGYFLVENWLITAAGVVVGCALALTIGYELSLKLQLPRLDLYFLVGGVLIVWLIGQLAAWQPARRAAAVSPAVATRTI